MRPPSAGSRARVALADLDAEAAWRVAAELPRAIPVRMDVTDEASVAAGVARAEERLGGIDVIFNNAGIDGWQAPLHEMDAANWHEVTAVNATGVFLVLKHGLAALLRRGGGVVVNTSSTAGLCARANIAPYTFAKAGIIGLTRSAAAEYAAQGIRIKAVAPTVVRTALVRRFIDRSADPAATRARMESLSPMPGLPTPDDVAFLASDDARWITGHTLPVDGGAVGR